MRKKHDEVADLRSQIFRPMVVEIDITQETRIRALLASAFENQEREWRLLNTLSLLEHIGSRKIFQTHLTAVEICTNALKHLAEETRHAAFLKRAAETLAGRSLGFPKMSIKCLNAIFISHFSSRLKARFISYSICQ
jgi:hypothetical protein